jgi:acetyltransferase-like isoleucine patch superfamily enzyme
MYYIIRKIVRGLTYRFDRIAVPIYLRSLGVTLGSKNFFIGCPEVTIKFNSSIALGNEGTYISRSFSTALGVSHPLVLRTLHQNAKIMIGAQVGISGGSICAAKMITIGNRCLIGADVVICDTDFHSIDPTHRRNPETAYEKAMPVMIGDNVFIGTKAIILKGVTIGENSVIGAGSVVVRSLPANVIAAGNPCKIIRQL